MVVIVKRRGHREDFDERKVYASVYAACLSVNLEEKESEGISGKVVNEVKNWIEGREEVSSQDISTFVYKSLGKFNKHAAFMYETHRDIS